MAMDSAREVRARNTAMRNESASEGNAARPAPAGTHPLPVTRSDSPAFLLNQAVLTINGSMDRALAPNLTAAQWTAIFLLQEERITTASDLARALGTDIAATCRLVGRLVDKGYVARTPDPTDRRAIQLSLLPAAIDAYSAWRGAVAATLAALLDGIAAEDLLTLNRTLVRIVANGGLPHDPTITT